MNLVRVDPDDLVTPAMIAEDLDVSRPTVSNWIKRRKTTGFPLPVLVIGDTNPTTLYSRRVVFTWMRARLNGTVERLARMDEKEAMG